jgi:SSS family solute:Na+ symporter
MAFIVWFYVCTGGLKASTWVGVIQFVLLVGGIIILGFFVMAPPVRRLERLLPHRFTHLDAKFLEVPRVINFGPGAGRIRLDGGHDPDLHVRPDGHSELTGLHHVDLRHQIPQTPGLAAGLHVHLRGRLRPVLLHRLPGHGRQSPQNGRATRPFANVNQATVVPTADEEFLPPFMLGVVFMGAIAAIHSTAAPYIGTGGSILLRDVYWRYIKKQEASHAEQIWVNRVLATVLTIAALTVG